MWQTAAALLVTVVSTLVVSTLVVSWAPATTTSSSEDALVHLNHIFHDQYAALHQRSLDLSAGNSILLVNGSMVSLLHDQESFELHFQPASYNHAKHLSHVVVALWMMVDAPPDHHTLLRTHALVKQALHEAPGDIILTKSNKLLSDWVLSEQPPDQKAFDEYLDAVRDILNKEILAGSQATLEALHGCVQRLLKQHGKPGNTLWGVVSGEQMPEHANTYLQYLDAALSASGEGDKVFYATHRYSRKDVLSIVRTHLADDRISQAIFKSKSRMHSDLLGPTAKIVIEHMKAQGELPIVDQNTTTSLKSTPSTSY